tara:strand:- start:48 stop:989 length:942 start_codon:yes stop_codon:yes gene_type:complete
MPDYKILPADQEILKTITANSTWNDLTVSFRNKILPAGNLNKPIGEKCYKLLKTLIKKDKVSASTLSKGCPLLTKTIMKNQNTSIAKMEMKSDNSAARRRGSGGGGWNKGAGKAGKTGGKYGGGSKDDYYEKLVSEIVKKQLDAEKLILSGQVETVNKVLVDTTQKNTGILYNETLEQQYVYAGLKRPTKEQIFNPDKKMKQEAREGRVRYKAFQEGKLKEFDQFIIDTRGGARAGENVAMEKFLKDNPPKNFEYDNEEEAYLGKIPAHDEYFPWSDTNSVNNHSNNNDNYEEFVIPQYSVELDPILNDPRNN